MPTTLKIVDGRASGSELEVDDTLEIGREAGGAGTLENDPELSRHHARITRARSGDLVVQDLGSTNGTFVNGTRISAPEPLLPGDELELGSSKLAVVGEGASNGARPTTAANAKVAAGGAGGAQPTSIGTARPVPVAAGGAGVPHALGNGGPAAPSAGARPAAPPPPVGQQPVRAGGSGGPPPPAYTPAPPGGLRGRAIVAGLLALIVVGGIVAIVIASSGGDGNKTKAWTATAQGVSVATVNQGVATINIKLGFLQSRPFNFKTLSVHKFLDARHGEPFRVFNGTYTMTDADGDQLVMFGGGHATNTPMPPDNFFGRSDETLTVKSGTGKFKGASGSMRVVSVVALDSFGKGKSAVEKHIDGKIKLK